MISIIIPYTDGDYTRGRAFYSLMSDLSYQTVQDYELVLVEQIFHNTELPFKFDAHYTIASNGNFNKSWCINVGVKNALHDKCMILDADMRLEPDYLEKALPVEEKFIIGYKDLYTERGRDNPEPRVRPSSDVKAAGGVWFVDKDFFWSIGGMNETYSGYGAEDNDFYQRAKHVLGEVKCLPIDLTHAYHHWHPKGSSFPVNPDRVKIFDYMMQDKDRTIKQLKDLKLGGRKPQPLYYE